MKTCTRCGQIKPVSEFQIRSASTDGFTAACKCCIKVYDDDRARLPHRVAARIKYQKTEAYALSHEKSAKRWAANHPDRRKANVLVNNAVRDGRILPMACWACGSQAEAHHPDYSRPLDVVWLCKHHHRAAHEAANDPSAAPGRISETP